MSFDNKLYTELPGTLHSLTLLLAKIRSPRRYIARLGASFSSVSDLIRHKEQLHRGDFDKIAGAGGSFCSCIEPWSKNNIYRSQMQR